MDKKLIALVGRPNVGKSTLFNRLSINKKAIVFNIPGVTRDIKYSEAQIGDLLFKVVDTPGFQESIEKELEYQIQIRRQIIQTIIEANLVCFIVDNLSGITPTDKFFANLIRKYNKNYLVIVNKSEKSFSYNKEFYSLGFGIPVPISAQHNEGFSYLYDRITSKVGVTQELAKVSNLGKNSSLKIIIAGRPNAGKSTFINAILGKERLITGKESGITRESVEVEWEYKKHKLKIIDTAGLKKKAKIFTRLEELSMSDTISSIKVANTVVLLLDATSALEQQDLSIANYVIEKGKNLVIAVNKFDLIKLSQEYKKEFISTIEKLLPQGIPVIFISAVNKYKINGVLDKAIEIFYLSNKKIATSKLNEWLIIATKNHQLPIQKKIGRRVKLKYVTQVKKSPLSFKFFSNDPDSITETYIKYLLNSLRKTFFLPGVPIKMYFSKNKNPYTPRK